MIGAVCVCGGWEGVKRGRGGAPPGLIVAVCMRGGAPSA